jgi:hypothetical protein
MTKKEKTNSRIHKLFEKKFYFTSHKDILLTEKIKKYQDRIWELDQKLILLETKFIEQKSKLMNKIGQFNLEIARIKQGD